MGILLSKIVVHYFYQKTKLVSSLLHVFNFVFYWHKLNRRLIHSVAFDCGTSQETHCDVIWGSLTQYGHGAFL